MKTKTYGLRYDYKSIVHYGRTARPKKDLIDSGLLTIKTKDKKFQDIIGKQKRPQVNQESVQMQQKQLDQQDQEQQEQEQQ